MMVRAGTSGFSYKEWKPDFYPDELADGDMLAYYGERLPTVEINNTFYKLPRASVLEGWADKVPPTFVFALKASQRITHRARLRADSAADPLAYLWKTAQTLGQRLGPILFQMPPNLKLDLPRLVDFLALVPDGMRAAFEFRHPAWATDEVYDALRQRGAAWCVAETDQAPEPTLVATAPWGYLRLRKERYGDAELAAWAQRLADSGQDELYVYFKHDDGAAPVTARRFSELCG